MIPEFPNFAHLELKHIPDIIKLEAGLPEYSDYNVASLIAWDVGGDTLISNLHGNLVIIFSDYMDGSKFISMYGTHRVATSIEAVLAYAREHDLEPKLRLVPEETARKLQRQKKYVISSDRDNYDYVIGLEKVCQADGRRYRKIRREVRAFENSYGSSTRVVDLDLKDDTHVQAMIDVFYRRESCKPDNDEQAELEAIQRLIRFCDHFDLVVKGVRINDTLEAFVIIEKSRDQLVEHFCKGNTSFAGINQFLLIEACRELRTAGFKHMNIEQDLGIEGLRMTKESLQPVAYLKKYSIEEQPLEHAPSAATPVHQQLSLKLSLS